MMSIFHRLISQTIAAGSRKFFCSTANREVVGPWLMLPPSYIEGGKDMVYNFYSPIKDEVVSFNNRGGKEETQLMQNKQTVLVGSSHGWLALFDWVKLDIFLCNPISGRRIVLPPYRGEPFRAVETWAQPWRMIMSCSPDERGCCAIMVLGSMDRAAFCRPGLSSRWTPLGRWHDDPVSNSSFNNFRVYLDFVYSAARKSFLGYMSSGSICSEQELEGWDVADPSGPRMVSLDRLGRFDVPITLAQPTPDEKANSNFFELVDKYSVKTQRYTYLVTSEHSHQLFLVKLFVDGDSIDFNVYRIYEEHHHHHREPQLCSSLDDLVIFVGMGQRFAVKASRFPGLKPNCIYFSYARYSFAWYGNAHFIGIFDYQTKTLSPLYYPSLHMNQIPNELPWFIPTLD